MKNTIGIMLVIISCAVAVMVLLYFADRSSHDSCIVNDPSVVFRQTTYDTTMFFSETVTSYRLHYIGKYRLSGSVCEKSILVSEEAYRKAEKQK